MYVCMYVNIYIHTYIHAYAYVPLHANRTSLGVLIDTEGEGRGELRRRRGGLLSAPNPGSIGRHYGAAGMIRIESWSMCYNV